MPHGSCFLWNQYLTGIHVSADFLIAIAYFSIPALMFFNRRHASTTAKPVLLLFAAFILSCGVGHLVAAWNIWHTEYWLEGVVKLFTAGISVYTAIELQQRMPIFLGTQKALIESEILARKDPLTGLANRRVLDAEMNRLLTHSCSRNGKHVLLIIDLDGFKQVNDRYGHPVGDELLKQVAHVLTQNVLPASSCVARLGGDEFALLLENCTLNESIRVAQRLRTAIAQVPMSGQEFYPVQASIGITELACQYTTNQAYEQADKALYHSKAAGKNLISWMHRDAAVEHSVL